MATKVLIVDDSAVVRRMLTALISKQPGLTVVGAAPDPFVARDMIVQHEPDVLTLDIEMPRMDGVTFLRKLMAVKPIPTVVVSSLTAQGSELALDALAAGAVEVIHKGDAAYDLAGMAERLVHAIRAAASARIDVRAPAPAARQAPAALARTTNQVVAIGSSTGGVSALEQILTAYPANAPGTIIVQHMPPGFTRSFADRLAGVCAVPVRRPPHCHHSASVTSPAWRHHAKRVHRDHPSSSNPRSAVTASNSPGHVPAGLAA
jgi:two-component system chemotaxis response regulator CheB